MTPRHLLLAAAVAAVVGGPATAATVTIVNGDGAGEGFNDPTVVAPVTGNPATTLGQQRLNAFQAAANTWGARLASSVTILVSAQMNPLTCTPSSAVLGSAGPVTASRDFSGAPRAATWYSIALANSRAGSDLAPASNDINATFNSSLDPGTPGCLGGMSWWYGIGASAPAGKVDFVGTVLHELGHGVGFLTFVDVSSGAKMNGFDDTFMVQLEDHSLGLTWPSLSNAQRVTSATDTGDLHWVGANVIARSPSVLTSGFDAATGHVRMYAPASLQLGSSVSHWDTVVAPNELMEPIVNSDMQDLITTQALQDTGWLLSAPNTAPGFTPGAALSRQRGSPASVSVVGSVSDAEQAAGSLAVTLLNVPAGISVTGITNTGGSVSATVSAGCTAALGANTVTVQVSDGSLTSNGTFTVNVTADAAPTVGTYPSAGTTTGGSTTVTPSAPPADNGGIASATATAPGFTGTLSVSTSTGVVSVGNAGPAGPFTVTVTVTDNCGLTTQRSFTLTVTASGTAPTFTPGAALSRQRGSPASISVVGSVSDAEQAAGSLVVTLVNAPDGISVTGITNTGGSISATVSAGCSAALGANTVTVQVSDGSLTSNGTFTVNVTADAAPTVGTYPSAGAAPGGSTTVTPSAPPADNGGIASATAAAPGFTGTLSVSTSTGVVSVGNAGPEGPFPVTVTIADSCGLTTQRSFTLTVSSANTPPSIVPVAAGVTLTQGAPAQVRTIATVSDGQTAAGSLLVTAGPLPGGVTLTSVVNTDGTVSALVGATCGAAAGDTSVTLTVSDGSLTAQGTLAVHVVPPAAPAITAPAATTPGTAFLSASVPKAAGATYAWTVTNGTITAGQGTNAVTFTAGAVGTLTLGVVETKAGGCPSAKATRLVVVRAPGTPCVLDGPSLCLNQNRFRARVTWANYNDGSTGPGHAAALQPVPNDSGTFWFFEETNVELFLKVLNGTGVNGKFWVLYGALTDVGFTMTIEDTVTGASKTYVNPPHVQASVADILAFDASVPTPPGWGSVLAEAEATPGSNPRQAAAGTCVAGPETLCLNASRFDVRAVWTNYNDGVTDTGKAKSLTTDSGTFWFFDETNVELALKVLDGRGVNGHFWVLYGALSDVEYSITITDTETGAVRSYYNPPHVLGSKADITAF